MTQSPNQSKVWKIQKLTNKYLLNTTTLRQFGELVLWQEQESWQISNKEKGKRHITYDNIRNENGDITIPWRH